MKEQLKMKVAVIGAGMGGIAAAVSLAGAGLAVDVYEKNDRIGGMLNIRKTGGFTFDLGPSVLILPQMLRTLFERVGRNMDDYLSLTELKPHWRNYFEDGTSVDLTPDMRLMEKEIEKLGDAENGFYSFLEHSREQYRLIEQGYFREGFDSVPALIRGYGLLSSLFEADTFRSMAHSIEAHITSDKMAGVMNCFSLYAGSSPYDAPAVLSLLPYAQFGYGLWYVRGGMYNLARSLERLMDELGVCIHLSSEVAAITPCGETVTGITLNDGRQLEYDLVVANMDVLPAYERLLRENDRFLTKYDKFEPSCSGLVLHLGLERKYPALAHHNFFHSRDPRQNFDKIFQRCELPDDPTVYVAAPSVTDAARAPADCENVTIVAPVPHIRSSGRYTPADYLRLREVVLAKLERMGLTGLRRHIVAEDLWTPDDVERHYYANKGAFFGVVADGKNLGLKFPRKSEKYDNLYFVGGSVNPGAGIPLACLSGQLAADSILAALPRERALV
jgi:diapolycopene oxygenase